MKINGVELEDIDLMEAEQADKYEKAMKKLEVLANKNTNYEGMSLGDVIRSKCNIVFEFFNIIWGDGTDKKVFGGRTNIRICTEAVERVVSEMKKQESEINAMKRKYSSNRADRRNNNYNKNKRRS